MLADRIQRKSFFKNPRRVVNICFIFVFICSTLLTWREMAVLEDAWISNQRNSLDNVATALDRQLQHSLDNLLFYRNIMSYALRYPISTDKTRQAMADFERQRTRQHWQIKLDVNRSMPLNGVSDKFVDTSGLLVRDADYLHGELSAALEFSYILQLSDNRRDLQHRTYYLSRAGFYISSRPPQNDEQLVARYYRQVARPWFSRHSERYNRGRGLIWEHAREPGQESEQVITASVPLDYEQRWYGVLAMDFTIDSMRQFLLRALQEKNDGLVLLYDRKFNAIATSADAIPEGKLFTPTQMAQLASAMENKNEGEIRMAHRVVTWDKLNNFDGVLVKLHSLDEGIRGEFGRISVVLGLLWTLFSLMLGGSWLLIHRLVKNMMNLQSTLSWRANYDTLTRLFNRGAFFEQAQHLANHCRQIGQPFAVIQLDLDRFKCINDRFGHDSGDRVLASAGAILSASLRGGDIAGRIGGEEFCIVLPGSMLSQARAVAERIRERINSKEILVRSGQTLRISASFGVSASQEHGDYDFEHLQSVADGRLYKAKEGGRNRVCDKD
ncbi:cellulose biosynthesis regulator YedQ [Erwinia sp. CPCC 100877]|nr:cellulose biosynthesis regulator YedQ [Erwinia sp. CPCC 100877]